MVTPRVSGKSSFVLTARECQIVALVVEGCRNRDIARRSGTQVQTVKNQLTKIYEKTSTSSRVELVLYALQMGVPRPAAGTRPRTVEAHARRDIQ